MTFLLFVAVVVVFALYSSLRGRTRILEAKVADLETELLGLERRTARAAPGPAAAVVPPVKTASVPESDATIPLDDATLAVPAAPEPQRPPKADATLPLGDAVLAVLAASEPQTPPTPIPARPEEPEPVPPRPMAPERPGPVPHTAGVTGAAHQEHRPVVETVAPVASARTGGTPPPARARIETWETAIGGSWLNRIGIALLVIGITFALGYSMTVLGPAGKAALATTISLALIASGVLLERREPYAFYARGLIGGGWAALYATAYAAHELEATRVVESAAGGFLLLLAAGAGMIVHSLRYRNQGLTALAYGLAYAAIVLHSISGYTLFAAALLGAGTVAHELRRRWYGLAMGGALASYGSLLLWYMRQEALTLETLRLGLGALALNWIVFLTAELGPDPQERHERDQLRVVCVLNAFCCGVLSFLAWKKLAPAGAWLPLVILGLAYVVTSTGLRRTGRTVGHPIHSLAAALLLAAAAYEGLDSTGATWVWLAEAQAIVLIGLVLKDRFHRVLGCDLFLAPMVAIVHDQGAARLRSAGGTFAWADLLLTGVAVGCFYLTYARLKGLEADQMIRRLFSFAAFVLILLALWVQLPAVYVPPAVALLALLLFEISILRREPDLRAQTYIAACVAAVSALALPRDSVTALAGLPGRVTAMIVVALVYYVLFARLRTDTRHFLEVDPPARRLLSWGGTGFTLLALWVQLPAVYFPPAAALAGLILFEVSSHWREPDLRAQTYVASLCAAVTGVALSPASAASAAGLPQRVPAMIVVALAYYAIFLRQRAGARKLHEIDPILRPVFSWLGTGFVGLAIWLEARATLVGPGWMLLSLLVIEVGISLREPDLRRPGYAALAAAHVSVLLSNLTATDVIWGWSARAATIVPVLAATYYLWWRLRDLSHDPGDPRGDRVDEIFGRVLSYGGAVLAGLFARFQFGLDGAALRWSVAMVALFAAGYLLRDADFRLQAYALAAGITVRAVGFDFQAASPVLGVNGPLAVAAAAVAAYAAAGWVVGSREGTAGTGTGAGGRVAAIETRLARHGRDILWILGVLLAAIYSFRTLSGFMLIVAWAVEGLLVSGAGFGLRVRSLRLAGLGLLALGLVMTFYQAFRTFDTIGRIVSFMVMGIVLLLISFAYTRYREVIRRSV